METQAETLNIYPATFKVASLKKSEEKDFNFAFLIH
jgi:hypothetical protein